MPTNSMLQNEILANRKLEFFLFTKINWHSVFTHFSKERKKEIFSIRIFGSDLQKSKQIMSKIEDPHSFWNMLNDFHLNHGKRDVKCHVFGTFYLLPLSSSTIIDLGVQCDMRKSTGISRCSRSFRRKFHLTQ